MRAAVYLRQSLDRDGTGEAIDRQREDCLELVARRGWEAVEFVDNDTSASNPRVVRKGYSAMLAAIERGEIQAVVVWHLDRLHRRPVELEHFIDLADRHRLQLATVTGDVRLDTDTGRMVARITGAVARAEVERKSARHKRANLQRAQRGVPNQTVRPFGYELDGVTQRPEEAVALRDAYDGVLAGRTIRSITRAWNEAGITSTRGNPFTPARLSEMLRRPRYAGLRDYQGEVVGPGAWEGVVTEDVWRAVQGVMSAPERRWATTVARKHLLPGLMTCGRCGAAMKSAVTSHGHLAYKCTAAHHLARAGEPIETYVQAVLVARLRQPDLADLLVQRRPETADLRLEINALRARQRELDDLFVEGTLPAARLLSMNAQLEERLEDLHRRLAASQGNRVMTGYLSAADPGARFLEAGLDEKRAVISTLVDIVVLSVGRGVRGADGSNVLITWKSG